MKRLLAAILFSGLAAGALAEGADGRVGIGGAGGWNDAFTRSDWKRGTHGDGFWSGWLRLGVAPKDEVVLGFDSLRLRVKNDSRADKEWVRPVTLGWWRSFSTSAKLRPLATVGVGVADLRNVDKKGERSQSSALVSGGAGAEYFITSHLSLGFLGRVHYFLNENENEKYRTEGGLYSFGAMATFFWGGEAPEPAVVKKVVPQKVVEATPLIPPSDEDGDGVADSKDSCPQTPSGFPVDGHGCPLDSDNDGVVDGLDKCPATPAGVLVDNQGCQTKTVTVTLDVKFASGKADLGSEYDTALKKVADFMARFPTVTVLVGGHTDNVGSAAKNRVLSQKRSDAVKSALTKRFGVGETRITAKGFGPDVPLTSNSTPEGRAANRRVVAVISATE